MTPILSFIIGTDWIILICLMTLLSFTLAATLGIGGPLILLPILMLKFAPAESVVMIVPAMFVNNLARVKYYYKYIQFRPALFFLSTAIPLAAGAAFFTKYIPPTILKGLIVGIITYTLVSRYVFSLQLSLKIRGLLLWGIPTGLISGLSGTAGPPMAIAFRGYGLSMERFVATTAIIQAALQLVRLPGYLSTGILSKEHWFLAALMALSGLPAVFISKKILRYLNPTSFRIALDVLLGVIGVIMLNNLIQSTF